MLTGPNAALVFAIILLAAGSLALMAFALLSAGSSRTTRARLRRYAVAEQQAEREAVSTGVLRRRQYSMFRRLDALLRHNPLAESTSRELAAARVPLRVGEYYGLMVFGAGVAGCATLAVTHSLIAAAGAFVIGAVAPKLYVSRRKAQRIKGCEDQLVDLLTLTSNSLRSGWSFVQAMDHVTKELPDPISEEIRQVLEEVSLGATAEDALIALQQRIPSYDLELIVTAVLIQRRAGGNLAEMMDTIAHTIRERLRLLGEVRVITAEARMSMWLLALLPVGLLVVMSALNPGYMGPMLEDPRGQTLLLAAAGMELLGVFVLRRMSNIEV